MDDQNLLKFNLDKKKFIVWDFEGELSLYYGTPFQLGFLIIEGKNIIEEHDYYIKWKNLRISNFVKQYAHYDPVRMEKEGKDPMEVFSVFGKYLNNKEYYSVFANGFGFDTMLAYNCLKRLGLKHDYEFLNRCYDTNALFKIMKLGWKVDNQNLLAQQYSANDLKIKGLKSNVSFVAKEFGIPFDENNMHSALLDVKIIWRNFCEIIKRVEIK